MLPIIRYSTVGGIPVDQLIPKTRLDQIIQRTRDGGAEIVGLLKTGSAFNAPASSAIQMAASILRDKKRVLPCSVFLSGEYGIKDTFIGVPCVLGAEGVERIFEVELTAEEKIGLQKSADSVREQVKVLGL
jgi:malate dehydrogenase